MQLLNIEYIPGKNIQSLGLVMGSVVQSKNLGRDFMAGMKTLVGGEIVSYTQMLNEARQIATDRMVEQAAALGADAVVGVRYASASIMQGPLRSAPTAPPCASWATAEPSHGANAKTARRKLFRRARSLSEEISPGIAGGYLFQSFFPVPEGFIPRPAPSGR